MLPLFSKGLDVVTAASFLLVRAAAATDFLVLDLGTGAA